MKSVVLCDNCNKQFEKYINKNHKHNFCCRNCKTEWQKKFQRHSIDTRKKISIKVKGKNNPNYNNKWTKEQREHLSKIKKEFFKDQNNRYACGNANRDKMFSKKVRKNMSLAKKGKSPNWCKNGIPENVKKKIGIKSKQKWTNEYKRKYRKTMEEKGYFTKIEKTDDWLFYRSLSNWNDRIFDKITDTKQLKLLKEIGIKSRYNKNGVVRDHKYSRKSGFNNDVFPEILRHPVNCEILLHKDNTKKHFTKMDSISLNELFSLIENYTSLWKEQLLCLKLIKDYRNGKRYIKENYIKNFYCDMEVCRGK